MQTINLSEAKAHLGKFTQAVLKGRRFQIAVRNRPVAQLVPLPATERGVRPKLGLGKGLGVIPDDFDAPMEDFIADYHGS